MNHPDTSKVINFVHTVLKLRLSVFQEMALDAMLCDAKPATERVILRSRDGLELATKVAHGIHRHIRPLAPSLGSNISRTRQYEDCGLTRTSLLGDLKMRILEER